MGFFSGVGKAGSVIFNFRVDKWLDLDYIKGVTGYLTNQLKSLVRFEYARRSETYEEAIERLQLTPSELAHQMNHFWKLALLFLLMTVAILGYCVWLFFAHNLMGACMSLALAFYALTLAFRYHFWYFQMHQKRLGCTLQEWFLSFFQR